jgi:soluble lytic murein transglycosylase-like protein
MMRLHRFIPAFTLTALAMLPIARAAERVTLVNGFVENCHHHATVENHVRLYLNSAEDSYLDLSPEQIAAIENVPDPSPQAKLEPPASSTTAKLTTTDLGEMLTRAGQQHNLDVDLLASVVKAESNGNARAVSRAGAQGLMQLMPQTAAGLGVHDSFEPQQNVGGGSTYLDALLTRYHDNLALALAAYNAGPQAVAKYHGIPPYRETRVYVARVIHEFNRRVLAREIQARKPLASAPAQAAASQ